MFVPFAWMLITSFKTQPDAPPTTLIPDPLTIEGWQRALNEVNPGIVRLFFNSVLIAGAVTISNVLLGGDGRRPTLSRACASAAARSCSSSSLPR